MSERSSRGLEKRIPRRAPTWRLGALAAVLPFLLLVSLPAQAPAPEGREEARTLLNLGRFGDAEAAARRILASAETASGEDSIEAARAIDILVESLWRGGKGTSPEAQSLAERAVRIKERLVGLEDPEVSASLGQLGHVLRFKGQFPAARPILERALRIRIAALGPDHIDVAASLSDLAALALETEEAEEARGLYERALSIQTATLGPDHPDLARNLKDFGRALMLTGDLHAAKSRYEQAIAVLEKTYGKEHPDIASSLNGLAVVMEELGDYAAARPMLERALDLRRRLLGPNHFRVAATLNNLSDLLRKLGEYEAARPLAEMAIAAWKSSVGPDHPSVAVSMMNLAQIQKLMGDYDEARAGYDRALGIQVSAFGEDDSRPAWTMQELAELDLASGDRPRARNLYERSLAILRKVPGAEHEVALVLDKLGRLLLEDRRFAEARASYEEALAIQMKVRSPSHPEVATTLIQLAGLLSTSGDPVEARARAEQAIAIRRKALGPDHPLVAECLVTLSEILAGLDLQREAFDAALRAEEIGRNHLRLTARTLPERQALQYASIRAAGLDRALSIAVQSGDRIPEATARVWDAQVKSRAVVLDEMASRQRRLSVGADPETRRLEGALGAARTRLANLVVRGPDEAHPERYRELLGEARRQKEAAERALGERGETHRTATEESQPGLAAVLREVPRDTALVSFCLYDRYPVAASRAAGAAGPPKPLPSYLAFVAKPGSRTQTIVPLGTAAEVEARIERWTEEASRGHVSAGRPAADAVAAYRRAAEPLRAEIWDPVAARFGPARRVFVVPDGAIALINLASLPSKGGSYLIETGPLLHHLSAERDLIRPMPVRGSGRGLLAIGGPAFDDDAVFGASRKTPPVTADSADWMDPPEAVFRGDRSGCGDFQSLRFEPLPAAVVEAREIAGVWQPGIDVPIGGGVPDHGAAARPEPDSILLVGSDATEARLKASAPGRRILHLATHGFFLGGRCPTFLDGSRGIGRLEPATGKGTPGPAAENPLLISGLALAGANQRVRAGPEDEDGILTAEEIAAMDLSGAEWVVLSACNTATGDIRAGEGVFGLRRAFRVAGAATLIMSLWEVEDEAARHWMKSLYEARRRRLDTAESVREASLELLKEQRRGGRTTHPFYWAGFVAEGDWR